MVLPIAWPFAPDWSNGVTERLSWLTAIQTSRSGAEQRQALRVAPRRQLDFPIVLTDQERSYFEVLMARNGGTAWNVPLPHEEISIGPVPTGTMAFTFDTSCREISVGTQMLLRDDGLHTEIVEVTSVTPTGITTTPTTVERAAASITPTFLGLISDKPELSRRTGRVYTGTVRFLSMQAMAWPATARALAGFSTTFQTYPVLTHEPNAINDLTYGFERMWAPIDNSQSLPRYVDKSLRQFTSQQYEWFLYGRQAQQDFRDRLFYLQGRCKPLWVPTFNDDIAPGTGYPNPLGFESTPPPGREYIARFNRDGTVVCLAATAYATGDRIPIAPFDGSSVLRNSFMALKRLDVDDIEILHHSDIDGVATVSAVFREAPNLRQPLGFTGVGFSQSGYWPNVLDSGTRDPATNPATGLTDVLTITGIAGGGS
jgi:hypothetical protein